MHTRKYSFRDLLIFGLVVMSTAFYDIKVPFILTQVLALASELLFSFRKKRNNSSLYPFIFWAIAFLGYCTLSLLWISGDNFTAISTLLSLLQVIAVAVTIILYSSDKKNHDKIINYIIIASVFLAVRFFVEIPTSSWGNEIRFSKNSIFGSNTPAISLAYSSILIIWKNMNLKKKNIWSFILVLLFLLITILMGTKKSILIFLLGLLLLMMAKSRNLFSTIRTTIIVLAIAVLGYVAIQKVPVLYGSIGYRMNDFMEEIMDDGETSTKSTAVRKRLIEDATGVFMAHPVIGVGQDGYRYENSVGPSYSHCNYTELLANLGIIGFLIYYFIYIMMIKIARQSKFSNLVIPLAIVMFVSDISIVSYLMEYHYILLGLIFGLISQKKNDSDNNLLIRTKENE